MSMRTNANYVLMKQKKIILFNDHPTIHPLSEDLLEQVSISIDRNILTIRGMARGYVYTGRHEEISDKDAVEYVNSDLIREKYTLFGISVSKPHWFTKYSWTRKKETLPVTYCMTNWVLEYSSHDFVWIEEKD